MAGLQSYVLGNQPPQPARTDRLTYASTAKVSTRKSLVDHPPEGPWTFQRVAPTPGYASKPTARRNAYPTPFYPPQQPAAAVQNGVFDDTLSGFDDTESTVEPDEKPEAPSNGANSNQRALTEDDYVEHSLSSLDQDNEHFPARPPTPRAGGISGRFHQPPPTLQQHAKMELRPIQNGRSTEQHSRDSNKGSRSDGQGHDNRHDKFDASSSGEDSTSDSQNDQYGTEGQKRHHSDYDDQQLESMTYKDLKDETWESENHGRASNLPKELQDPAIPLSDRFENCVKLDLDKVETQEMQVEFFGKMSTSEWEEAGDLFIGRFAEIIRKLKDARQAKRKIATDFEKLIEEREKVIRGKAESLDKDFDDMRKGGQGVIRGKIV